MGKVGIDDYRFSEKNKWRLKVWSELARRVKNPKTARILYLAGEQDLDREIAKKKGFRPYNMIAVEMDDDRAKALRKKGVTTIKHNLIDVVHAWPKKHKIDVVVADFCFGFTMTSNELYSAIGNGALINAEFVVNFQRGRDAWSNPFREAFSKVIPEAGLPYRYKNQIVKTPAPKHRAFQFLFFQSYKEVCGGMGFGKQSKEEVVCDLSHLYKANVFLETLQFFGATNPKFMEYKSNRVYMDSAVFSSPVKNLPEKAKAEMEQERVVFKQAPLEVKRSVTAALAVSKKRKTDLTARTM